MTDWVNLHMWLLVGHILGVLLWVGGLTAVFWVTRMHTQMPDTVNDKFVLMERSLAMMMDIAALLAMGAGVALALHRPPGEATTFKAAWLHVKLTIVVLGLLSMHGMLRVKVGKLSRGEKPLVPTWMWSVILLSVVGILVMVFRGPMMFAKS
jgi:uncharacterized membrane protein